MVTFELSGFQAQQRTVTVAATQTGPLNVTPRPAAVEETIVVVGRAADVLTLTGQVATSFSPGRPPRRDCGGFRRVDDLAGESRHHPDVPPQLRRAILIRRARLGVPRRPPAAQLRG
jgi:hypothetical protein